MGENNKVLKVTYGNFSCRLEGFDDSVETLKSVVAYFHDLAGPTMFDDGTTVVPDLDTLERAVTHEGGANIDYTNDADGIDLRIQSKEMADVEEAEATWEEVEADTNNADQTAAELEDEDPIDDVLVDEPEDDFTAEVEEDIEIEEELEEEVSIDDDAHEATGDDAEIEDAIAEDASTAEQDTAADTATDGADAIEADADDSVTFDDEISHEDDADIVAHDAHLDVAASDEDDTYAAEANDADIAEDVEAETAEDTDLTQDDEDTDVSESPFQLQPEGRVDVAKEDETGPLILGEETAADVKEEADASSEDSPESVADKLQRIRAVVGRGATPEAADDSFAEDLSESEPAAAPKAANPLAQRLAELAKRNSEMIDADAQIAAQDQATVTPFQLGKESRVDSEIVKKDVVSEVISFAPSETQEESVVEDDTPEEETTESKSTPLVLTDAPLTEDDNDDDDNFDLHEEVAKIERELAARPGNELARHGLPRSVEDAMSRILTQTDVELDLQETRDGRDAFAQLKAAVAATEAARQLGDRGPKTREVTRMFRDELGAIEEDDASNAASLKVVDTTTSGKSTLREVAPLAEAASRLREIAQMTEDNGEGEDETFGSFIASQDVSDLSDKLEAAAAFLSFVENEADFSRPQLMRVVQSEANEEISREDGLRSFGRLLRQARIVKLPNGRFQVAENTRFRPTSGRAAQG